MKKVHNGLLISIEGIDGSGKSSLGKALQKKYSDLGYYTILTKEPGGTDLGKKIRKILLQKQEVVHAKAEFLLFASDRAQHFSQVIIPSLHDGAIVISDRMADSSLVYQGYGRGLDISTVDFINRWAMNERTPDIVLYLKLSTDEAYARIAHRNEPLTSFEKEKAFIETLEHGFEEIFVHRPEVVTLDATQPKEILLEQASFSIEKKLS